MRLGSSNIRNFPDMRPTLVAADAKTTAAHCSIAGFQEIQPGEDTDVVIHALGPDWTLRFKKQSEPLGYDHTRWEGFDKHKVEWDRPRGPEWHHTDGHGAITSLAFRHLKHTEFPEIAVVNTHLLNNAYFKKSTSQKRKDQWDKEFEMFGQVCAYHLDKGRHVFPVGDFNRGPNCPTVLGRGRWFFDGIVKIGFLPAVPRAHMLFDFVETNRYPMNSDHDLITVTVRSR